MFSKWALLRDIILSQVFSQAVFKTVKNYAMGKSTPINEKLHLHSGSLISISKHTFLNHIMVGEKRYKELF